MDGIGADADANIKHIKEPYLVFMQASSQAQITNSQASGKSVALHLQHAFQAGHCNLGHTAISGQMSSWADYKWSEI